MNNDKALIGIDGGATKTEFVMFTENGKVLKRIILEGSNPNVCGLETACKVIKTGLDELLETCQNVLGVFAGIAGTRSGNNAPRIRTFLKNTYPQLNMTLDSDICNVISSTAKNGNCAAVICGTGFSIYANVNQEMHRVGGWGYLLDDISGGFGLGREALRAALAEQDGFGEKTIITQLIVDKLGTDVWDSIDKIYTGGDSFIASFAPIVFEAYGKGDKKAYSIFDKYTDQIVEILNYTLKTYNCDNRVVLSGGLFNNNSVIVDMLRTKMTNDIEFMVPKFPQIYGACVKCCKLYGKFDEKFLNNFAAYWMKE